MQTNNKTIQIKGKYSNHSKARHVEYLSGNIRGGGGGETGSMYLLSYQVSWYVHWQPLRLVHAHTYEPLEAARSTRTYL